MKNWLNDTARTLNGKIYKRRLSSPSIATKAKWHKEFVDSGSDKKMSFVSYLKIKTREWHKQRYQKARIKAKI